MTHFLMMKDFSGLQQMSTETLHPVCTELLVL